MALEEQVVKKLIEKNFHISFAESCTGGMCCGTIVNVANASKVLDVSFVTYANEAKIEFLGVKADTILSNGVVSEEVPYDACWERSTECIKKLVPVAEKLKVKICLENVWNNFLLSPIEACSYIDQFKSPYVRFYFDCGNILVYGWPEQWIPILGKRIGRIHIKEFSREIADREGRWNGFNVKLTEGNVNWAKVMEQIRKHYRGGWLTTEQGGGASPEELQDLCARLDRIFEM